MTGFRWNRPVGLRLQMTRLVLLATLFLIPVLVVACGESATPTSAPAPAATEAPAPAATSAPAPAATEAPCPGGHNGPGSHTRARRAGSHSYSRAAAHDRPDGGSDRGRTRHDGGAGLRALNGRILESAHGLLRRPGIRRHHPHQLRGPAGTRQRMGRDDGRSRPLPHAHAQQPGAGRPLRRGENYPRPWPGAGPITKAQPA